LKIKFLHGAA